MYKIDNRFYVYNLYEGKIIYSDFSLQSCKDTIARQGFPEVFIILKDFRIP